MTLAIGDTAPDFEADTTVGRIGFHDWIGDSWAVLFSHPKDFAPATVAEQINHLVQENASDGFILVPHVTSAGREPLVERVVPLLQERGVFRTDYAGTTLRDHLGIPLPQPGANTGVATIAVSPLAPR